MNWSESKVRLLINLRLCLWKRFDLSVVKSDFLLPIWLDGISKYSFNTTNLYLSPIKKVVSFLSFFLLFHFGWLVAEIRMDINNQIIFLILVFISVAKIYLQELQFKSKWTESVDGFSFVEKRKNTSIIRIILLIFIGIN